MKIKLKSLAVIITLFAYIMTGVLPAAALPLDESVNYEWNNLKLGNYCWMTGMVMHPADSDLIYVRTDVGGMYRYNPSTEGWIQLLDGVGHDRRYLLGVSSIALDPTDPDIVYAACGKSFGQSDQNSDIIKSTDRGETWEFFNVEETYGIYCGNDTLSRTGAESLVIDPNNTDILYFGTQSDGLWKSEDGGSTWRQITDIPENDLPRTNKDSGGVSQVYIDSRTTTQSGASKNIYAAVWGHGVYWSSDGGENFTLIPNTPMQPVQMQIVNNAGVDKMYVTSNELGTATDGGIYLYQGADWTDYTDISPSAANCANKGDSRWGNPGFGAFMIDKNNPDYILVYSGPWRKENQDTTTQYNSWHSEDGGETWSFKINAPLSSAIIQDSENPDNIWISAAQHVYYVTDQKSYVSKPGSYTVDYVGSGFTRDEGIEGLCTNQIVSLPGADTPLALVGAMDHGLRIQEEWNVLENKSTPKITNLGGVDFCEEDPSYVFETGVYGALNASETGVAAYSTNYGRIPQGGTDNFTNTNWNSQYRLIDCAVGAVKQPNGWPILMVQSLGLPLTTGQTEASEGAGVWRSLDNGNTWELIDDITVSRKKTSNYINKRMLESDRVNGNVFYYSEPATDSATNKKYSALYRTKDGGDTWDIINMGTANDYDWIKTIPFIEGGIWYYSQAQGKILASYDFGDTWTPVDTITPAGFFGFGVGDGSYTDNPDAPATYVVGEHDGDFGMFISDDLGRTWTLISPESQTFPIDVVDICGDRNSYGSVFVATGGRGALYGNGAPVNKPEQVPDPEPEPEPEPEPPLPEGAITYNPGDSITLSVKAKNTTANDKNFKVIVAFYDYTSGVLKDTIVRDLVSDANKGPRDYKVQFNVPSYNVRTKLKAFIFDNFATLTPLFNSISAYEAN